MVSILHGKVSNLALTVHQLCAQEKQVLRRGIELIESTLDLTSLCPYFSKYVCNMRERYIMVIVAIGGYRKW